MNRALKICLEGILLPLALLFGAYRAVRFVVSSPLFLFRPDQDVRLSGNHVVSTQDVLRGLELAGSTPERPASLFRLDLASMRRRIQSIPWIESASMTRVFPDRLDVTVLERTPIAYTNVAGRIELVDEDGVFLQMPERARLDFPILYGLGSGVSMAQRRAMLAQYEQFVSETRDEVSGSGWSISEADLSDPDDLRALLVQGRQTVLAHFGAQDYRRRFQTFVNVAPQALAGGAKVDSMDLRFRDEVVVDPVEDAGLQAPAAENTRSAAPSLASSALKTARAKRRRRFVRRAR